MSSKALKVVIELDVHAVTCPGVWLSPKGKVALRVCMLGYSAKTSNLSPVFPLLYHEKFVFEKIFTSCRQLSRLQNHIEGMFVYAELLQRMKGVDIVLATFETSVLDLLYPTPQQKKLISGVDVDLLMDPTLEFPGIIAPKIEISTKTTIEEIVNPVEDVDQSNKVSNVINPKMLTSMGTLNSHRKLCDNKQTAWQPHRKTKTHRAKARPHKKEVIRHWKENQPPFSIRPGNDEISPQPTPLKQRGSSDIRNVEKMHSSGTGNGGKDYSSGTGNADNECKCKCSGSHSSLSCTVCSIYKSYFGNVCMCTEDCQCNCGTQTLSQTNVAQLDSQRNTGDTNVKDVCRCGSASLLRPYSAPPVTQIFKQDTPDSSSTSDPRAQEDNDRRGVCSTPCDIYTCKPLNDKSHRQMFYKNLEKFYLGLYRRAKLRAREEKKTCACGMSHCVCELYAE